MIVALSVVTAATVTGAAVARWRPGRQEVWSGAAAGALLVLAGLHLLPDAWQDAAAAGLWPWLVPAVAAGAFATASALARIGHHREYVSGAGAAAALAGHRFLEGSTLALAGSVAVVSALAVHAFCEGLAVGALVDGRSRRAAWWLAALCAGPIAGAVATSVYRLPDTASPLLVAVAAGVVAQAARVSLRVAFRSPRALVSPAAPALAAGAALTAAAVHLAG